MEYSLILLAAGKGSRTHLDYNKVLYHLDGKNTVLDRSLQLFSTDPDCVQILVVCAPYELSQMEKMFSHYPKAQFVTGGQTRQDSVWNGLQKVKSDTVLIHDGARPYLSKESLEDLKRMLKYEDAALLMIPSIDTVKILDENGYIINTPERRQVWRAQTPQGFRTSVIKKAFEKAYEKNFQGTDDAQLVELFGHTLIACVEGDTRNLKITEPQDLVRENFD